MGSGKSPAQRCNEGDCLAERADHQASHKNKPGRKPQPKECGGIIANLPAAVLEHFFPCFRAWLESMKDPRNPERTVYSVNHLIASSLLMFLTHMKSRRQLGADSRTPEFLQNLLVFAGSAEETMAHPDTMNAFFKNSKSRSFNVFYA